MEFLYKLSTCRRCERTKACTRRKKVPPPGFELRSNLPSPQVGEGAGGNRCERRLSSRVLLAIYSLIPAPVVMRSFFSIGPGSFVVFPPGLHGLRADG